MLKRTMLAAATVTFVAASPVHGQPTQTPENARKFIGISLSNGGTTMQISEDRGQTWTYIIDHRGAWRYDPFRVTAGEWIDDCRLRPKFIYKTVHGDAGGVGPAPSNPIVDFAILGGVETNGIDVELQGADVRFRFASESLATRAAFAMSFLKDVCDPTAGLGF